MRTMCEVSFNDVCKRYYHFDDKRYLRWFCGGGGRPRNNFPHLAAEYEIVVFLENLRACVCGATRGALPGVNMVPSISPSQGVKLGRYSC